MNRPSLSVVAGPGTLRPSGSLLRPASPNDTVTFPAPRPPTVTVPSTSNMTTSRCHGAHPRDVTGPDAQTDIIAHANGGAGNRPELLFLALPAER